MALADLLRAIRADADEEIMADRRALLAEAEAVVARASDEADALERELATRAATDARLDARRRVAAARLGAVRRIRSAREEAYLALRTELAEELRSVRRSPGYPRLLRELVQEALTALPGTTLIEVDPRDAATARELLAGSAPSIGVEESLLTWGGVQARDPAGRTVVNTLEQRLRDADPRLRMLYARAVVAATGDDG